MPVMLRSDSEAATLGIYVFFLKPRGRASLRRQSSERIPEALIQLNWAARLP